MAVILVTGGAGYIGSFTCRALLDANHQTITYDNLSKGHREMVQGELLVGDIRYGDTLRKLLVERKVEAVMHFAANIEARESVKDPATYYDNNVHGLITLLTACRDAGVGAFVFSSTCAIYGTPKYVPIDENHPDDPISPYARSKLMCEWVLRDFSAAYGLRHAALRYFNAAGGDREGRMGEWHQPETHLIPRALEAAATEKTLSIFGDDHGTPDGTCIRDYIHVQDLARGHVLALEYLLDGGETIAINMGTGTGRSVREVVDSAGRAVGREVSAVVTPAQAGDPPHLVANAQRARDVLGFECQWTDLDDITASAWAFHRKLIKTNGK